MARELGGRIVHDIHVVSNTCVLYIYCLPLPTSNLFRNTMCGSLIVVMKLSKYKPRVLQGARLFVSTYLHFKVIGRLILRATSLRLYIHLYRPLYAHNDEFHLFAFELG